MSDATAERWEAVRLVMDWLRRAGFEVRDHPSLAASPAEQELALQLIEEEVAELRVAVESSDLVEIADALGDIVWVALEAALTFGIPIEPVFEEIHRSNESKLEGERVYNTAGKLVGGDHYVPPDLLPILAVHAETPGDVRTWQAQRGHRRRGRDSSGGGRQRPSLDVRRDGGDARRDA